MGRPEEFGAAERIQSQAKTPGSLLAEQVNRICFRGS
jgi:hypothetical protein